MKRFIGRPGRTLVLELQRGDGLLESIREQAKDVGIRNAMLTSAVGSLMKLVIHKPTNLAAAAEDAYATVEEAMEICSLIGSVIGGEPHLHIVAASPGGLFAGHVENDTRVLYMAELTLTEIDGVDLERRLTRENVKKIFVVGSPAE
ncbi:MAG: PPC domain-containing DNA-binding protein [Treponemataceae bacterium]